MGLALGDLRQLAPELSLVIAFVLLIMLELFLPRKVSRDLIGWLALAATAIATVFVLYQINPPAPVYVLGQSYRVDDFSSVLKLIFLIGTSLVILMNLGHGHSLDDDAENKGEFYYLLLPAVLGAMIMVASADLITLYVGLELLSITSYILVGIRRRNHKANEAAFKYLVQGGISSALILYGMSFLYGISGTTVLNEINVSVQGADTSLQPMIYVAFFLLLAGFGFKIAAAPFHTWVADTYEGASTPIAAFLAVVSKGAGLGIAFRVFYGVFYPLYSETGNSQLQGDVFLTLSILAATAMVVGNLLALRQKNMKRLLAYSGVANAGYLLVPLATQFTSVHTSNFSELVYYLVAYLFMTIGAFAVVMMLEKKIGAGLIGGFSGLYHRAPWTAMAMTLLILSLAGFPVTAGFFGKLFILLGAVQVKLYWLAIIMVITSILSYYYYFRIVRQMFMHSSEEEEGDTRRAPWTLVLTVWVCALTGVGLGFYPQVIIEWLQSFFSLGMDLF
ncbi:MAG: NADH-quinone oxidoreductase subunit N [Gorillibacterium sp.]|nr:NADH-quinone oxidoreductase subunit N [Gorillibacterium sp.]